uniref:Sushi, von Willebrand factor type A, EGF and pentraxin domain-containing protein 1 n=1 Tax=Romanomermis culicivorax TaxID=13658 RepID=A0A915IUL4_ROMCU
ASIRCQHKVDYCSSQPCQNNATCINEGANYRCECKLGFDGAHCEHNINECETKHLCGIGTQSCIDLINDFKCVCKPGYTGEYCGTEIDECLSDPCQNNGTCIDGVASYSCQCLHGWTGSRCPSGADGKNCEIAPNRCIGDPCRNNGVCGDFGSRLECTCPKDFTGIGCQYELDACRAGVCKNGGSCIDMPNGYRCQCLPGFTGVTCETNVDDCTPSPCPLTARCIDQVNAFYCQCPSNTTGGNCEKPLTNNYDIRFYDPILPASAGLSVPTPLKNVKELTVAMWVRFEQVGGRGTFFTFYHSQQPNYPNKVRELLRINSEGMRIELFPDSLPLLLAFPLQQRVNDGHFNHVAFVWRSQDGSYSMIWNAVRLWTGTGYGTGLILDINAWVTLGYPVSETPNEPKFVGSISRVNVWSKGLSFEQDIPSLVENCQGAQDIYEDLALRWTGYDMISGKVEKVSPSTCGSWVTCPQTVDPNTCTTEQKDKSAPQAKSCPQDIYVESERKEVNVSWSEPIFVDDRETPLAKIEYNLKTGQVFTWGDHLVAYAAYDNDSNVGHCAFKVKVNKEFCPTNKDPLGGIQICESWGAGLKFKACSLHCEKGLQFADNIPEFYSCGPDGRWEPRPKSSYVFRYPQCSAASPATRMVKFLLDYPTSTICNQAGRMTLAEKVKQRINALNNVWKICVKSGQNGLCERMNVTVNCATRASPQNRRFIRQALVVTQQPPLTEYYRASIVFPSAKDPISHAQTQEFSKVIDALQNDILLKNGFNFANVIPNGRPDVYSLRFDDSYTCPVGEVAVGDECVACTPGSYFDSNSNKCQLCPIGQYQSQPGQLSCSPCSPGYTTAGPGAIGLIECKPSCAAGRFFNLKTGKCEDCDYGFFQPNPGSFECLPCGLGKTTVTQTSTLVEDCKDECPDGQQLTQAGQCRPCDKGTYKAAVSQKTCVACPAGFTTEKEGSVARDQCVIPMCHPGQFLITSAKQCQSCPKGTYQDEPLQTACKPCAPDHTTANIGSLKSTECYSTNQCETNEHNCHWHSICIDLPDELFKCECKPGFRGNGTYCEDACSDFCLNDGLCKKDPRGVPQCECKQNFQGEKCEIRFQPSQQKVSFIAGGVGGVVTILVVMVVVIWMICFRFQKDSQKHTKAATNSDDKSPSGKPDTGNDVTFLYGRPYTEQSRALPYYYEDDDEEYNAANNTKSMYINDSFDQGSLQDKGKDGVDKDEMFERLRRINNHVYRPKRSTVSDMDGSEDNRSVQRTLH